MNATQTHPSLAAVPPHDLEHIHNPLPRAAKLKTLEQWWSEHAAMLAVKMKMSGVASFKLELNEIGAYSFEVNPAPRGTQAVDMIL